jgi:16S rRNA C967 or C1407 C5-methylase (RsmB/RsmF family)
MGGKRKRHAKGNNSAADKKVRKESSDKWKSVRGDDNRKFDVFNLQNSRFEAFYKAQHFLYDENDFHKFLEFLRLPLPACFRINPNYPFADELRKQLLGFAGQKLSVDDVEVEAVEQMAWYPGGNGYKLGTDRRSIRKKEAFNELHKWLMQHTDNGNITRQEAVSMVPPIALHVASNHKWFFLF